MNSLKANLISLSGCCVLPLNSSSLASQHPSATDAELPSDYCTELERMGSWVYNERRSAGGLAVVVCEEERRSRSRILSMDMVEPVVCPKPRRLGVLNPSIKRCAINQEVEIGDAKAGRELLDMIITKGSYGGDRSINHVALSPPAFYCGSPPSRASNPVIQDAQFGSEKITPLPISPAPPSPSSRCTRMKFGHKPAAVRVEGFDCLSRDQRNCSSISAVA